jgi:hypothetical protein
MIRIARVLFPGVLILAAAGAALADPPAPPASPTQTATAAPVAKVAAAKAANARDDQKVVCKYEQVTGSRLEGHKVCMTKADWAAQSSSAMDAMRNNRPLVSASH